MQALIVVLLLILIGLVAFWLYQQSASSRRPGGKQTATRREVTLRSLRPGDVVGFWTGGEKIVKSVLQCQEELEGRITRWQWVFLDDGQLVEVAPEGLRLIGNPEVVHQGTEIFERLVPPTGVLGAFEDRVREGEIGRNPVYFDHGGRRYRVASTGTFTATVEGDALEQEVWRDLSENAADNVYFELEMVGLTPPSGNGSSETRASSAVPRPEGEPDGILGVWTTHILLGLGRPLSESDVKGLYGGR